MNEPGSCQKAVPRLMSVTKAATYLGLSKKTLYYWIETKRIPFVRVGSKLFFMYEDIEAWIDRCTVLAVIPGPTG